jgi:hypothetical protein
VISYFLVLISVLTTGLITTMALTSGGEAQVAGLTLKRDSAFYAAEAGLELAYWKLCYDANWRAGDPNNTTPNYQVPMQGTVNNAGVSMSYSVTAIGDWNSPVSLTATGFAGTGAGASSITITAVCTPLVIVPAISLGNNFDNSGNVTITGDVMAEGNIASSGKFTVKGSLFAGGTINTTGSVSVSGSVTPNFSGVQIPTVDEAWVKSHATTVVNVGNGNKGYDVGTVDLGNGGIVYFKGGATLNFKSSSQILGHGTIVTDGDISVNSAASIGSSSSKAVLNIIADGSIDVSGYLGIVGSVYVGGTITKHGGIDITGIVVGNVDLSTNGGMTITKAQPPSYFQFNSSSGPGSMKMSSFTGPIF